MNIFLTELEWSGVCVQTLNHNFLDLLPRSARLGQETGTSSRLLMQSAQLSSRRRVFSPALQCARVRVCLPGQLWTRCSSEAERIRRFDGEESHRMLM